MSKRLIHRFEDVAATSCVTQVYYDSDYGEYEVRIKRGKSFIYPEANYFTDDKTDAMNTASHMLYELASKGY